MFENFLFVIVILASAFWALVLLVMIILWKKGNKQKILKRGILFLLLPLIFIAGLLFHREVVVPMNNKDQLFEYSDSYFNTHNRMHNTLDLSYDGSFTCKCPSFLDFPEKGTWNAGGLAGDFNFYKETGELIYTGRPEIDSLDRRVIYFSISPQEEIKFEGTDF